MVYTAAQTGAQRFIEMVFSTLAGQVVFNSYKDRNPLPEDVARANGHEELAQYLHKVHTRYCVKRNLGFQEVTLMCIKAWLNKESNRKDFFHLVKFKRNKSKRGNVILNKDIREGAWDIFAAVQKLWVSDDTFIYYETNEVLVTIKWEAYLVKSLPGGRGLQLSLASKPY